MKTLVIGLCGNSLFYNKETNELLNCEPGGKGYNQAVGIKKLGQNVSFIGAVGNDESADLCSNYLDSLGINNLLIKKDGLTTYANIFVDAKGNNYINVYEGVKLGFEDLDYIKKQIEIHDIVLLQNEIDVELNKKIIEYSKKLDKFIMINPAPAAPWVKEYLNIINFVTPNEEEARCLFNLEGVNISEFGLRLVNKYKCKILITLGSKGCLFINNNEFKYFDSIKVNAVDTTGAGDLMNASVVVGFCMNLNFEETIKLGTKACAYSVQRHFVLNSYPYLKELI